MLQVGSQHLRGRSPIAPSADPVAADILPTIRDQRMIGQMTCAFAPMMLPRLMFKKTRFLMTDHTKVSTKVQQPGLTSR